jgi:glycosyltransferase involved in cell wall biosynthesis
MPRVSVVIPAYNCAATIGQTLKSVQDQTFADWEVLVGDDASTDDTVAQVEALGDLRIRALPAEQNGGPAAARNRALRHASGDFVAFLDADDWWLPNYLERQVGRFDTENASTGDVGAVACDALLATEDGTTDGRTYLAQFGRRRVDAASVESLLRRNTIYVSCLVPRAIGEELGWFDTGLFGTEDHDLWLKILETGRRIVVQVEPLAVYRQTTTSISRNTARQAVNNQRTLARAIERGKLSARQRRIVKSELRYNRALAAVAGQAFDGQRIPVAALPTVAWVALSRPRNWAEWASAMRAK